MSNLLIKVLKLSTTGHRAALRCSDTENHTVAAHAGKLMNGDNEGRERERERESNRAEEKGRGMLIVNDWDSG